MSLRKLLLPTMIAAALAGPASAQNAQAEQDKDQAARKAADANADAKAGQVRKEPQAAAQKDRKDQGADKARKARAEEQPDEPEEDDR